MARPGWSMPASSGPISEPPGSGGPTGSQPRGRPQSVPRSRASKPKRNAARAPALPIPEVPARGQDKSSCGRNQMTGTQEQISQLLREASETHHRVFRIVDGADDDWASWYACWLIHLSELPALLVPTTVRSELIYMLVRLDKEYSEQKPAGPWEDYYARAL